MAILDGVIEAIGPSLERPSGVEVVDLRGHVVTPGFDERTSGLARSQFFDPAFG